MKYEIWLTYEDMSIAIQIKKDRYHCSEYGLDHTHKLNLKICSSTLELKFFLLSFPSPPKQQILAFINLLENNKIGEVNRK